MKAFTIIFTCICISFISLGQAKLTKTGFEPVVIEVEKQSSNELFKKTSNWVQETYENPDEVFKAKILNAKIRIKGFMSDAFSYFV